MGKKEKKMEAEKYLLQQIERDIEGCKKQIKDMAKSIIEQCEEALQYVDNEPEWLNACGIIQKSGVSLDMEVARLKQVLRDKQRIEEVRGVLKETNEK